MPDDNAQIDHGRIEHLAILAHELRGPLAAIDLAVGVLEAQAPDLTGVDAVRDDLDKIVLDAELLEAVIGSPDPRKKSKEIEIKISKRHETRPGAQA